MMFLNDKHYALLRILAGAEVPQTTSEIAAQTKGLGRWNSELAASTVKTYLKGLEWNSGHSSGPLARPAGTGPRNATTWEITSEGRRALDVAAVPIAVWQLVSWNPAVVISVALLLLVAWRNARRPHRP